MERLKKGDRPVRAPDGRPRSIVDAGLNSIRARVMPPRSPGSQQIGGFAQTSRVVHHTNMTCSCLDRCEECRPDHAPVTSLSLAKRAFDLRDAFSALPASARARPCHAAQPWCGFLVHLVHRNHTGESASRRVGVCPLFGNTLARQGRTGRGYASGAPKWHRSVGTTKTSTDHLTGDSSPAPAFCTAGTRPNFGQRG